MGTVVVYDPLHSKVTNAVTTFLPSGNTPAYQGNPNTLVNPDLSLLWDPATQTYLVPLKYWKWGGGSSVVEMNSTEKDSIDTLDPENITLNAGVDSASGPTGPLDATVQVERGPSANASFKWDETLGTWVIGLFGQEVEVADIDLVPTNITDLGDVRDPMAPTDGQVLTWNNGTGEWENQTISLTVNVAEEGSNLGQFNSLNFIGAVVTAADGGGGEADITINAAPVSHTHAASDVISGTFADARISASSVTQHEGSINHDNLLGFVANEHATPKNSIEIDVGQLQLVNDAASPGANQVYGTNGAGTKGWKADPAGGGGVPATEYAESEGTTSTTGTGYTQKLRLSFTANAADYLIQWSAEIYSSDSGTRVETRVQLDDSTDLSIMDWNPDIGSGTGYGPVSGLKKITLTAGTRNIDFDFSTSQSGKSVSIRRARIIAMEVT